MRRIKNRTGNSLTIHSIHNSHKKNELCDMKVLSINGLLEIMNNFYPKYPIYQNSLSYNLFGRFFCWVWLFGCLFLWFSILFEQGHIFLHTGTNHKFSFYFLTAFNYMLKIKSTTSLIWKKITFVLAVLHIPILHFAYMMKNSNRQQTVNKLHPRQNMNMGI